MPTTSPLLTDKWLVYITCPASISKCPKFVERLIPSSNYCVYVFSCTSEDVASYIEGKFKCKRLDRRIRSPDDLEAYVTSRLNISKSAAKKLVGRCKRYAPRVISNVETLSMLGSEQRITSTMVDRFVQNRAASFEDMYKSIVFSSEFDSIRKQVLFVIDSYKGAPTFLWKYLLTRIEQDIAVITNNIPDSSEYPQYQIDFILARQDSSLLEHLYKWKALLQTCKRLGSTGGFVKFVKEVKTLWS